MQAKQYAPPQDAPYASVVSYYQYARHRIPQSPPKNDRFVTIHKQQYAFDRKLAIGRFSTIYAARRRADNRPVAIKAVSLAAVPKGETSIVIDAHLNDVQSLHHLTDQSKHVIHMYDFDFQPSTGLCLLILELGREDLDKYLSERAALSPSERRTIWRQLVNIVNTLHRNQMMHLNITPDNLIVFPDGTVKITDFGMAQKINEPKSVPYGIPPYSAPELSITARHRLATVTPKADIWSVGALLYRMTYTVPPDNIQPCYLPPPKRPAVRDHYLRAVLRSTLRMNPVERPDATWLAKHAYTTAT